MQAGAIGIIGGADGPTAIFLSSKLAPNLMGAIAVSAYSYMAFCLLYTSHVEVNGTPYKVEMEKAPKVVVKPRGLIGEMN